MVVWPVLFLFRDYKIWWNLLRVRNPFQHTYYNKAIYFHTYFTRLSMAIFDEHMEQEMVNIQVIIGVIFPIRC